MLVLCRRVGESIVIDGRIVVTVTVIESGRVRLGVTAPPQVQVDRTEVWRARLQEEGQLRRLRQKNLDLERFVRKKTPRTRRLGS